MAKGVFFKRRSKGQGRKCHFCSDTAIWEAISDNSGTSVLCCGSKHCRKKAEKSVS